MLPCEETRRRCGVRPHSRRSIRHHVHQRCRFPAAHGGRPLRTAHGTRATTGRDRSSRGRRPACARRWRASATMTGANMPSPGGWAVRRWWARAPASSGRAQAGCARCPLPGPRRRRPGPTRLRGGRQPRSWRCRSRDRRESGREGRARGYRSRLGEECLELVPAADPALHACQHRRQHARGLLPQQGQLSPRRLAPGEQLADAPDGQQVGPGDHHVPHPHRDAPGSRGEPRRVDRIQPHIGGVGPGCQPLAQRIQHVVRERGRADAGRRRLHGDAAFPRMVGLQRRPGVEQVVLLVHHDRHVAVHQCHYLLPAAPRHTAPDRPGIRPVRDSVHGCWRWPGLAGLPRTAAAATCRPACCTPS